MRQRGFTLIEVIVALLILGLVVTTTLAVFVDRTRRLQQATETMLAWQALANETEVRRRINFADLDTSPPTFMSQTAILAPLSPYTTDVTISNATSTVKNVTMTIRWRRGARVARLAIVRADTGGSNLW
jgi:prepilin-type N-terminal cleavage/methylation domain-containing protein